MQTIKIAVLSGVLATFIGLFTFLLSWNLFDIIGGPLPGYRILLFPGNLTLVYFWHPLFSEEVDLIPKLGMILLGQFIIVSFVTLLLVSIHSHLNSIRLSRIRQK